jgi:asparagine synthase (glutamine-hydrolysing)
MSTIGGIYNFDGAPVEQCVLTALGDSLARRGTDGGSESRVGSLGMVYRAFHTNRESRREVQPFVSNEGHILCWDGRLDNRDELVSILRDELLGQDTDVAIVLVSYQRWGMGFLSRIIGDFALALWDSGTRTLLLARDPSGPRPLFYHFNKNRIIWSSELSPLLHLAGVELEVNDDYVAGYLTREPELGLTPYRDIHAVPPAHVIQAREARVEGHRFWRLDPTRQILYRTEAEYEEHFRHLFNHAVRCRLRVDGPVWAQLSGGLDSSSIVCMADEIMESGDVQATKIETVSHVYGESDSSDERALIKHVEERRGRNGCHLREEDYAPLASFPIQSEISFPDFLDCFIDRHNALCEAMREDGARVLLTGHGGDQMLCSTETPAPELADLLVSFRLLQLNRRLRSWGAALKRSYFHLLWDSTSMLLPRRIRATIGCSPNMKLPPWLHAKFAARMNLAAVNLGPDDPFGFHLPSSRDQVTWFLSAVRFISSAAYRDRGCIEVSHPYLHRPLIEFLQAVPFDQKVRPGETRSVLRRALRDLLPAEIQRRRSKRGPEEAFFRAVAREWPRLEKLFADAQVCARGYMDAEALSTALERARHGCERYSFALIKTISLEFWLRALERREAVRKVPSQ